MTTTPRTALPLLAAAQAQKHVTHNDALLQLDALLFARFLDRDLSAPPSSPADGDTYLVKATASGAWTGQGGKIAYASSGAWRFAAPFTGLAAYVVDENKLVVFTGSAWVDYASILDLQNVPLLGVGTTADVTNKLAVKSSALLFDNIGNGVQAKLNKNAAGDTASLLYQTAYSGRAEIGLCGDDDFHFKVSADGSTWYEALKLARTGGGATFVGAATAASFVPSGSTVPANGVFLPAANTLGWSTNAGERARLTASGHLLLGTATDSAMLTVNGSVSIGGTSGASGVPTGNLALGRAGGSTTYIVDIACTQNTGSIAQLFNNSGGAAAYSTWQLENDAGHISQFVLNGTGYTTSGVFRQDGTYFYSNGAGGLSLITGTVQPIYFAVNNAEVARFDANGYLLAGYTSSNGAYRIQCNSQMFATNATIATSDLTRKNVLAATRAYSFAGRAVDTPFSVELLTAVRDIPALMYERTDEDNSKTQFGYGAQHWQAALGLVAPRHGWRAVQSFADGALGLTDSDAHTLKISALEHFKADRCELEDLRARLARLESATRASEEREHVS